MKVYYIGSFPPTYGGVTIKNKNLFEELQNKFNIRKIDMNKIKHGNFREMLRFCWAVLTGRQYVIGLAGQKNRRQFTKFMYWFKRKAMRRSILVVMGGIVDDLICAGTDFLRMLNTYKKTYVELLGMLENLETAGLSNGAIYPNGRPRPDVSFDSFKSGDSLKCVFFSIIQPEKGVDMILQAARMLPWMQFHFYGEIQKNYSQDFLEAVHSIENTVYHGVFAGSAEAVYRELSQYDVLLFPTRWKAEGLPGILVEAKIAGVPAVVSDHNFNKEIVSHNCDGVVIEDIDTKKLVTILEELNKDRAKLFNMKLASRVSAEKYYIDICAQEIITCIQEEQEK